MFYSTKLCTVKKKTLYMSPQQSNKFKLLSLVFFWKYTVLQKNEIKNKSEQYISLPLQSA